MDPRFVLQKIEYMWTDLDQVHAKQIRQAYDAERATGKGHADALNALRGKYQEHQWHASPYKMLIPLFTQAHPQKLWDAIILPGQKVVLSRKEFFDKCPPEKEAQRQIDRFKIWKKTRCSNVEWQKVRGAEREAIHGAGSLDAAFEALHGLDPKRFPSALYGMKSTGFRRFVRYVFEFWGNTEYRYRAMRPGHGFDYAHQTKTIVGLEPVVDGVSIDYVPVFVPPKTTQPVTPGKNKIAATKPPGFEAHIGKLKEYAQINAECEQHMDNLHSHQARCESLARTFETFHQIYPSLKPSSLPKAAAAMRRLANLTDTEVCEKDAGLFTRPPAFSFGGLVRSSAPASPPFEAGIKATGDMVRLLTEDPEFAKSAHSWIKHAVDRQRGTQETMAEIADAVGAIRMVDDTLAGNVVERFCDHVLAAPDVGVTASSQLSQPGQAALIPLLEVNGTRIAWRAIKLVPEVVGNFQGPPSFTVALVNAAGFLGAKHLDTNHKWFKTVKKLFDKSTAARLEEAVASKSTKKLERAAARGGEDGPVVRGAIAATPDGKASALFREASTLDVRGQPAPHVRVTAQPFVVEGPGGPWLTDTAFIEAFDKTPSRVGRAAVDGELSAGVGDEEVIRATAQEQVRAPPWVSNAVGLPGYRDRRIRRLIGTEKDPIRIWWVPKSA